MGSDPLRWWSDLFGWFSTTVIVLVLGTVIVGELIGRWYRDNEWRRRARDADDDD